MLCPNWFRFYFSFIHYKSQKIAADSSVDNPKLSVLSIHSEEEKRTFFVPQQSNNHPDLGSSGKLC